jgi:hypothetical protein
MTDTNRALFSQETSEVFLVLLTIEHIELVDPIRLCNNNEEVVSRGQTYIAFRFDIQLPTSESESPPKARIKVDNVDRRITESVRIITSPPTITMEVIRASSPNTVELSLPGFTLTNVTYNALTVSGDLGMENFLLEPYPGLSFDPGRFPGLF